MASWGVKLPYSLARARVGGVRARYNNNPQRLNRLSHWNWHQARDGNGKKKGCGENELPFASLASVSKPPKQKRRLAILSPHSLRVGKKWWGERSDNNKIPKIFPTC